MINFINFLFDVCVQILNTLAKLTNTTYEQINIIIFVFFEPIVFIILLFMYINKSKKYNKLIKKLNQKN